MQRLPKRIFIFLSSLNFTILLLALLVLTTITACMADEIIPLFRSINPSRVTAVRSILHVFAPSDLHQSFWFKLLVIVLSLNLLACMVKRIPGSVRVLSLFCPEEAGTKPSSFIIENTFTVASLGWDFEHRLCALLAAMLSRPAVSRSGVSSVFFSQCGKLFHAGFYLAHGGLFIILTGGVLGFYSSAGDIYLREGESTDRLFIKEPGRAYFKKIDGAMRLDACEPLPPPTRLSSSSHTRYRSTVTLVREGTKDITGVLEGYRTFTGHGMRVGQARAPEEDRYRITLSVLPKKAGAKRMTLSLRKDQFCTIPETGHTIRLKSIFLPPSSPGPSFGASLEIYGDNQSLLHVPRLFSPASTIRQPWNEEYEFVLERIEDTGPASRCMRLSISFEPGAGLIWTGSAIAVAGFSLMFLLSHRKLWVTIERNTVGHSITVAGWASRNPDGLAHCANLVRELACQGPSGESYA